MDREAANEASRLWVEAAAQTPEAQALIALGWQVVSPYGYSHPSGWTIEDIRTNGRWQTLCGKGAISTIASDARSMQPEPMRTWSNREAATTNHLASPVFATKTQVMLGTQSRHG
ncbi:hypothetical protein [Burkholderia glumae]|uniref:hypothetical protein n=1 Tax=Burkholderia glumae TaxID=337 RepID=UPI003B9E052E